MVTRRLLAALSPVLVLLLLGPGCKGSSGGGGGGVQPSGTLTITAPSDVIKCGACQPFTASYTRGGTPQTVTATWSTDNPAVATIDPSGQLTAVSNGDVTVTARYEGLSAIKSVHIVNDYGTLWAGNYVITRCEETYDFEEAGFCDEDAFEDAAQAARRVQAGEAVTD